MDFGADDSDDFDDRVGRIRGLSELGRYFRDFRSSCGDEYFRAAASDSGAALYVLCVWADFLLVFTKEVSEEVRGFGADADFDGAEFRESCGAGGRTRRARVFDLPVSALRDFGGAGEFSVYFSVCDHDGSELFSGASRDRDFVCARVGAGGGDLDYLGGAADESRDVYRAVFDRVCRELEEAD